MTMVSRVADRPPVYWAAVGYDYLETDISGSQLLLKHDLTQGEFNHARTKYGWSRRTVGPADRGHIIRRLFRLADRMLANLEQEMTTTGDKEVAVLGRLVQSVAKLIDLETAAGADGTPKQSKELLDIRGKLVARIEELKRN
jgi:hypothetical protein